MNPSLDRLCRRLGHRFSEQQLLENALTHRSASSLNNERLEFLGDAVISFVVSSELYARFPQADEGTLSRLRALLVRGETLAELARDIDLGDYLTMGSGELKSGGYRRESILADAMEAVVGAVYLDAGIEAAYQLILSLYGDRLQTVSPADGLKDPKTRLQEYLQGEKLALPIYEVVSVQGDAHAQTFVVTCRIADRNVVTTGEGTSRRKAEQAAAATALRELGYE